MKLKHQEIIIDKAEPFINCKLERKQYAEVLSELITTYSDGFVLAINNEWGAGKTTFVKMWQQMLINKGIDTVYFNAWENDFELNPLVAIMAELKTITKTEKEGELFKDVLKKGSIIAKSIIPAVVKAVAKKYAGADDLSAEALEKAAEGITEVLDEEIKEFANKKKAIVDFRIELEKLISSSIKAKPLVFIIDELDRCRPDYSVEVLENLKHLFTVKGIVFVLSIDKVHLSSSVKGYYGSSDINTEEYLRRFIDIEYTIPQPSNKAFINYLFDYYSFNDFFVSEFRSKHKVFNNDAVALKKMAELLFNNYPATLRQQERIFALTRISLKLFKENEYIFSNLFFFLVYLKILRNNIYTKIENKNYSLKGIMDVTSEILSPLSKDKETNYFLVNLQAFLLFFYNNDLVSMQGLYELNNQNKPEPNFKSTIDTNGFLVEALISIERNIDYSNAKLSFLLERINLIAPYK